MASSKEYLNFIFAIAYVESCRWQVSQLEQLSELDDITYRAMMGEFIIYYRGKIVGGIYDDRLLVKPAKSAIFPRQDYEQLVKSRLQGVLLGHIVAGVVVMDYGNTTNEGMQTSRCRGVDFNGSSNRQKVRGNVVQCAIAER